MMKEAPKLQFHEKRCNNCRYYRISTSGAPASHCLLLGRMLSFISGLYSDMFRYCEGWKRLPKIWNIRTDTNPFWSDKYISRKSQKKIRARAGIKLK